VGTDPEVPLLAGLRNRLSDPQKLQRKRLKTPKFACDVVGSDAADGATTSSIIRFGEDHNSGLTTGLDFDVCSLVAMLDPAVPIPTVVSARTYGAAIIFVPIGMYVVTAQLRGVSVCIYVISCGIQFSFSFSFLFLVQVTLGMRSRLR
jgi:hypothetical protein